MKLSPFQRNELDKQKSYMDAGFDKLGEQIDAVESNLGEKVDDLKGEMNQKFERIDKKFDRIEDQFVELRKEIPRHMGILREGFRDDLKIAVEFMIGTSGGPKKEISFGSK